MGRRHRRPTAALLRALKLRDRSCRFPGCAATRHLHAHHVVHWADDGPTDLGNLMLLCGGHHRQIHQPGWQLTWGTDGAVVVRPAGADGHPGPALAVAPQLPGVGCASAEAPDPELDGGARRASAEAPDRLTPQHWSDDDPLQVDLLIAILEQELAQVRGAGLAQVA